VLPEDTKLISVDDHIVEPPHTWSSRVPKRYLEAAPHVVELENGRQAWSYEGRLHPVEVGMVRTLSDVDRSQLLNGHVRFDEMRPGCYDPQQRVADMDIDGVWAQLPFPTFARFAGHRFVEGEDHDLAYLCVQAYNDFLFDEWTAGGNGRLHALAALPMWNVEWSAAEVRRAAARGAKAIAFTENPTKMGLPSIHTRHWDPLWTAIDEVDLPICIHIGSSTQLITSSADAPWPVTLALNGLNAMVTCVDWIYSGLFERFPGLTMVLSEGGAGWVPYIMEKAEKQFGIHGAKTGTTRHPKEVFLEHIYACVVTDDFGLANYPLIGEDNLMWESDYPHNDGMWPDSRTTLEKSLADVPDGIARKIGGETARRVFKIAA
jgi:predicted TIM-barrel fold metal-dependent hydrolase